MNSVGEDLSKANAQIHFPYFTKDTTRKHEPHAAMWRNGGQSSQ